MKTKLNETKQNKTKSLEITKTQRISIPIPLKWRQRWWEGEWWTQSESCTKTGVCVRERESERGGRILVYSFVNCHPSQT